MEECGEQSDATSVTGAGSDSDGSYGSVLNPVLLQPVLKVGSQPTVDSLHQSETTPSIFSGSPPSGSSWSTDDEVEDKRGQDRGVLNPVLLQPLPQVGSRPTVGSIHQSETKSVTGAGSDSDGSYGSVMYPILMQPVRKVGGRWTVSSPHQSETKGALNPVLQQPVLKVGSRPTVSSPHQSETKRHLSETTASGSPPPGSSWSTDDEVENRQGQDKGVLNPVLLQNVLKVGSGPTVTEADSGSDGSTITDGGVWNPVLLEPVLKAGSRPTVNSPHQSETKLVKHPLSETTISGSPPPGSCSGECGGPGSWRGETSDCWCHPECPVSGDCCSDWEDYCGGTQETSGTPASTFGYTVTANSSSSTFGIVWSTRR